MSERITWRNLPHWYRPGEAHFVTYRLVGTIPLSVLRSLRIQRQVQRRLGPRKSERPVEYVERIHKRFFAQYDKYLDNNREIAWLERPGVAARIQENLHFHNGSKYHLLSYCVMPNHVHVLLLPLDRSDKQPCLSSSEKASVEGISDAVSVHKLAACGYERAFHSDEISDRNSPLSGIMHSLKSYTANKANKLLSRTGQFWQHESYDHWVRDENELERIIEYIARNPVRAGLTDVAERWKYCSSHERFKADGVASALLCPDIVS